MCYNTLRFPVSRFGQDTGPVDLCGAHAGSSRYLAIVHQPGPAIDFSHYRYAEV